MNSYKHTERSLIARSVAIIMPCVGIAFLLGKYFFYWEVFFCICVGSVASILSARYRRLSEQGGQSTEEDVPVDAGSVFSEPHDPSKEE